MPKPRKGTPPGGKSRTRPPTTDLLDQFSPYRVANILDTTTKKKVDTFESFVPKDGVCLDYNVSQTFLRMDAGNTKIIVKDTVATYVPVPPEMLEAQLKKAKQRTCKYSHGYPPQYVFVDEIWAQKQNELQELYKQNLLKFIKQRKKRDKLEGRSIHNRIQSMVGPDWYQELSPNQMDTADELLSCILRDLRDGTTINTQENIGTLGLVLRPNHNHIALALRLCCKCAIEFLLTLYQLINPNRTEYSLNDRLLLSAVVHLSMKDTLHEMHVRIPSPPRPEKIPPKPPKKPKQETYVSPYLKPFSFEPEKRKHTGVYVNKHVQHPESPYFAYRDTLTIEKIIADDVLEIDDSNVEPEEQELIEDWRQAQIIYDQLQTYKKVKLIKPTIVTPCPDYNTYCEELLAKLDAKDDDEGGDGDKRERGKRKGRRGKGAGGKRGSAGGKRGSADGKSGSAGGRRGSAGGRRGSARGRGDDNEEPELILPPLATLEEDDPNEICNCHPDAGICREHRSVKPCAECKKRDTSIECDCQKRRKLLKSYKKKVTRIIGGVVMTSNNTPVPIISGIYPPESCDGVAHWVDTLATVEKKCGHCQMIMDTILCSEHHSLQPCEYCRRFTNACNCRDRKLLLKEYRRHSQRIMGGVMLTKSNTAIPIVSGIAPPRSGDWVQALEDIARECRYCEKIKDLEKCCEHQLPEPCEECKWQCMKACGCLQKSKLYTTPKCRMCAAKEFKKNTQKWIGGIKLTKSNTAIPIISGMVPPKVCDCLQDYKNKIIAAAARNTIQCHKATFIIGGISITKDGPVYNLTAALKKKKPKELPKRVCKAIKEKGEEKPKVKRVLGPYDCTCCKDSSEEEEETEEEKENVEDQEAELNRKTKNRDGDNRKERCMKGKEKTGDDEVDDGEGDEEDADDEDEEEDSKTRSCKKGKKKPIDFSLSKPCEKCQEICECKEASKLITENKCEKCLAKQKLKMVERIIGGMQRIGCNLVPIVQGTRLQDSCECLQDYKDRIIGIAARNKIMNDKSKFVVVGVSSTKEGPVYILSTVVGNKAKKKKRKKVEEEEICVCKKKKDSDEEPDDDSPFKYSCCRCKEELDTFLSHKCTCDECMEQENRRNATYIKTGVQYTASGNVIDILSGVYGQRCNCLEKYLEKLAELDEYRKRIEARYRMKSQNLKYAIGGVVDTPNGPVYMISGIRPPVECECARVLQQKLEEQEQQRRMPKMTPTGRIKYEISGVKEMSQENVFIVSQALAVDDCDCMKLYNKFEEAHKSCLDTYDGFLKQVQNAIDEYDNELTGGPRKSMGKTQEKIPEQVPEGQKADDGREVVRRSVTKEKPEGQDSEEPKGEGTSTSKEATTAYETSEGSSTSEYTDSETESSSESSTASVPAMQLKFTASGRIDTSLEGETAADEAQGANGKEEKVKKKEVLNENQELKRFLILKKIPCNESRQTKILKRVLSILAEDGYPLAKLPNCHMLPHFKLWMQMRCGKFWTQPQRRHYELFSKVHWCHTDICHREVKRPQLGIDKGKAAQMTWRDAVFIRSIVKKKVGMYYRLVRQETIETAREFFPLTFSYEFPTPMFRPAFFSYLPSKEEDVLVYRIVKPHEARVNLKKFPCY